MTNATAPVSQVGHVHPDGYTRYRLKLSAEGNPPISNGAQSLTSYYPFVASRPLREQFLGGCDDADAHVWAVAVVSPEPLCGVVLCLLDAFEDVLVQPFMPNRAVVALDVDVLLGFSSPPALNFKRQ